MLKCFEEAKGEKGLKVEFDSDGQASFYDEISPFSLQHLIVVYGIHWKVRFMLKFQFRFAYYMGS